MISGKDITIDKDGSIILNGDKYPLASQAEIDAVKNNIATLEGSALKVVNVSATMTVSTQDADAIGGYRSVALTSKALSTFTGYPTGKVVVADSLHAYGANAATAAVVNVINGVVYLNAAKAGDYTVQGVVFYHD